MADYWLYCLDGVGKITAAEWIDATGDAEARHDRAVAEERGQMRALESRSPCGGDPGSPGLAGHQRPRWAIFGTRPF
jgi:hypothetical protein